MRLVEDLPAIFVILLGLFIPSSLQQTSCTFPSVITTVEDANVQANQITITGCRIVTGDVVIGDPNCSGACTVTSLFFISRNIEEIRGSLIVRCCNSLTIVSGWSTLRSITGSIIIDDNTDLSNIEAFDNLTTLQGNFVVRANPSLEMINVATTTSTFLLRVDGYIQIQRNRELHDLSYLSMLTTIGGTQLVDRAAIVVRYNPNIRDMSWLRSLTSIEKGVVHIEGNINLCYAGYPQWQFGSYKTRTSSPADDKGIDWRTFMRNETRSNYIWTSTNIPYLVVMDNAAEGTCGGAVCHEDCSVEAGCLGPGASNLCGGPCRNDGITDTCEVAAGTFAPTTVQCSLWPPAGPTLGLWIVVFVLGGIFILAILAALIVVFVCCCRKCDCRGSKDMFHVGGFSNPMNSTLDGAVAFTSKVDETSDGGVVLRNSSTFDQFSFSDNQGTKLPKQTQKNIRFSLVESMPPVNTYTVNEEENELGKSEEIKSLPSILKKEPKKEPPEELKENPQDEISEATKAAQNWVTTNQTQYDGDFPKTAGVEDVDAGRAENEKKTLQEGKKESRSASYVKKRKDSQPTGSKTDSKKVEEGKQQEASLSSSPPELPSPGTETGREDLGQLTKSTAVNSTSKKDILRSPSNVSDGGLTASAPTVDLSSPMNTATPLQEEDTEEMEEIPLNFPSSQIKIKKELGSASFGTVYVAEAKNLKKSKKKSTVVVKHLKATASKKERDNFLKPVSGMKEMKHENILALVGVCQESQIAMLLLEHCEEGPLKTFLIANHTEFPLLKQKGVIQSVALDIANGLKYLHSINIAHNDLACRNCLVTYKLSAKIGDYGLSRENFKEDYYSRQPGQKMLPIRWMAPELINTDREDVIKSFPPTFKGNMWSLGITLWELCSCCQWPYEDLMNEEVIEFVKTTEESVLDNPVEEGDSLYPMYAVMKKCWMKPENRPTASEVVDMLRDLQPKKKKVSRAAPVSAPAKSKVESKKTDNDKPIDPPALGSSPQKVQPPADTTSATGPGGVNDVSQDTFIKEKEEQFQPLLLSSSDKPQKEMTPEPQETSKTAKKATKDNAGEPAKKSKSSSKSKKKSTTEEVQGKPKKSRSVSKSSTKQEKKSSTGSKEEGRSKPRSYSSGAGRPKPSRDSYYGYGGDDDDDGDDPPVVVYDEDIAALIW